MVSMLRVEFENDKLVYAPGDEVKGKVVVSCTTSVDVNEIAARFCGKSNTGWYDAARKVYFDKTEYYIDNSLVLWKKSEVVGGSQKLGMGTHKLPFSFQIPDSAPCSFEGTVGWVRYAVNLRGDIPNRFNKEQKSFITVLPKADLNLDERTKNRPDFELKEGVGFLSSKYITIHAFLDSGGYVPGEPIRITLKFTNDSDNDISFVKVELEQKATFHGNCGLESYKHKRVDKKTAAKVGEIFEVKSKSQGTWQQKLRVPSLPPSDLPGCSIIDLQYRLLVKVKCGLLSRIKFKMPFIIGTVPLRSATALPDSTDGLPSYMESVFGKVHAVEDSKEEVLEGNEYSPMYQYYQWGDK